MGPGPLTSGTMLDDKYRIERLLANGGMGAVYLGTHTRLRKRVAIKVLNPQHSTDEMVERFHREAITASQIGHEGIAQVTDIGTSGGGEPFLVMEYLEGESLAARLRATGRFSVEAACELGCAILSPLGAAHQVGIVHRDLKPDNVYLVRQSWGEMVKLLDFGISRTPGLDTEARLTSTGLVLGTPFYMSPEQARGESGVTPASDLYAFGVMLYEMLVGDIPIRADNYNQLMYRVTMGDFEPPRARRPELPARLDQLIVQAMAQRPEDRPASAAALAQALLPFCSPAFRAHGTGRISAPEIKLRTMTPRPSRAGFDPAMYSASTVSDTLPDDLQLPPEPPELPELREPRDEAGGSAPLDAASSAALEASVPPAASPAVEPPARESAPGEADDPLASAVRSAPRRAGRRVVAGLALVAAAAAATALIIVALGERGGRSDRNDPVATTPPPGPPAATPATTPTTPTVGATGASAAGSAGVGDHPGDGRSRTVTPPAKIVLRFDVSPPGASISLDGVAITSPELAVVADDGAHRLRVSAPGFVAQDQVVAFRDNHSVVVQLRRAAAPRGRHREDRPETPPPPPGGIVVTSPYGHH